MSEEKKPACPRCESGLVVRIANSQHCNSCGADFAVELRPVPRVEAHRGWPVTFLGENES